MKAGTKDILIAGMALVIAGIILSAFSLQNLLEGSYSLTTIGTLSPGRSVNEDINMTLVYRYNKPGVNMSLAVDSEPSNVPINVEIRQPDGAEIVDVDFSDELFTTFNPTMPGQHDIIISNLGTQEAVSMKMEIGTTLFLSTNANVTLERNLSLTAFMIFAGFIVLIYGGIVLPIKERKNEARKRVSPPLPHSQQRRHVDDQQPSPRRRPTGLRIYALLTGFAGLFTIIIMIPDFIDLLMEESPLLQPTSSADDGNPLLLSITPIVILITMVTNGIAYLVILAGLLYFGKGWIWRTAVTMVFISIASSLTSSVIAVLLVDYYEYQYLVTIANIIINGTVLYYLYRPYVKLYFGKTTASATE